MFMRKVVIVAFVLVVTGLGVSFMLLPSKQDIAASGQRDQAQVDIGNVDVEAEYAQGRRSFVVISALVDKRIAEGNRPAAITMLEEYVKANPQDVAGHKKLAEQYQLAGDGVKYNAELEAIAAAEPNEANLKLLSDVYNSGQLYGKQADTLKKLVEITKAENPQYMADLATILVVDQRKEEALKVIQDLKSKHPNFRSYSITRIETSALVDASKGEEAYALADQWMSGTSSAQGVAGTPDSTTVNGNLVTPNTKELADLANILHYGGFADKAIALIEPRISLIATDVELASAYVNANITAGNSERAFEILTQIYNAGTMSAGLYKTYVDLALQREDTATVDSILAHISTALFNEEEAIALIELPAVQNHAGLSKRFATAFDVAEYKADKPVLAAVISLETNAKNQDDAIASALQAKLTSSMRVRLAEACYRADKTLCVDEVVKGFPALAAMTKPQVEEYANLHIAVRRADRIVDAVGAEVTKGKAELSPAYLRLAAASGREDVILTFLLNEGNTTNIQTLQQLYYIASDANQAKTASVIATKLYERDPSPMNREIIVASYLRSGEYAKALPLVRENLGKSPAAQDQYLTVLSKLAKTDSSARKELNDYALSVLSTSTDNKAQIAAAYTLLNNGERKTAMPYIKANAESRKGEWAVMWRQLNVVASAPRSGKPTAPVKLTSLQMLQIAQNPKSTEATRRQMAFALLNDGKRTEALSVFTALAANKGPDDQAVKDLFYLWGPKLNNEQIAWIASRAKSATSASEKSKWNNFVSMYGDDAAIVRYVSTSPDALYNSTLRKKYFSALASSGGRSTFDAQMREWVAGTTDVDALRDYAEAAQSHGYKDAAINAFHRIEQINPNDEKTLGAMGAINYAKGNYTKSQQYLSRYASVQASKPAPETNPQEALFYQAQLLRRQGKTEEARQLFARVVQASPSDATLAPDARSRLYTSYFHMGDAERGKQGFRSLLSQYPDDKGVLADYMSVLIEYHYTDEATAVANQYDKTSPYHGRQSMVIRSSQVSGVESLSEGREMRISFNTPIEGRAPIATTSGKAARQPSWVESTHAGYDTMVVSAKSGYRLHFTPTSSDTVQITPVANQQIAALSPQMEMQREQDLRLQLLYAQIEHQNGQDDAAQYRLSVLQQYYPNNPQLLTYAASLQSSAGNSSDAIRMLDQAQALSPENEDIVSIRNGIGREIAKNYVKGDFEFRNIGDNRERIGSLSGAARVNSSVEVGFNLQHDWMDTENIRRGTDGKIGNYTADRDRGELYAAWLLQGGDRAQASLYANNDTAGAGLSYDFNNRLGRSGILGEYHRPYWDFVEAVYEDTTRDRLGVKHYSQINPSLSMGLEASLNRYNTSVEDDVAKSGLLRLSLVQRLQEQKPGQPYLAVGYGYDGEYMLSDRTARNTSASKGDYYLLPIRTREVHFLSGILQHDLTPATHTRLAGGWAIDRFGGNGPQIEGSLTQDVTSDVEAGLRARYGLDRNSGNNASATNVGAHLMVKF
jgi:tetratricopeptide (TPR) repeat protein